MNFREYKVGARFFALALGGSMTITLLLPSFDISSVSATEVALDKQLWAGHESGFSLDDPLLLGWHRPEKVILKTDPKTGQPMEATTAYVYEKGTPFPGGVIHPGNLGKVSEKLSINDGHINEANKDQGAVFLVRSNDQKQYYIEDATATRGWNPEQVLKAAGDANTYYASAGKSIFVREGCWWCHTLLPEQTQDWQVFGAPPMLGDFNGESPTAFGSDRKAPDLLHVGSRNASKEWLMLHFFNPRLVQPHSIMPRFDYLWGKVDANGKPIDYDKWRKAYSEYTEGKRIYPPEVPMYASNSDARHLIDFILNLK
ncbi:cytochrome C oxidase, mono-heme subunit/FixO [Ferrovum sp. JA12]|uniref:cbb3-type cytochrome c oxidase subunit II n=1 Tax=Ferrovum sp. JA12 TaxID=1356299 RepID=UPI00070256E0|nr:cbb3-type cytochrome c oxidase subunit II [Ferrovum sp. JA12]KRH79193.1 cytochrome C oxidase, mono-heme subunit/FixO [Ferrovum sp. JA12]